MNTNAKLECTTDYDIFEIHECNRDIHENPILLESMKKYGFMPSHPLSCRHNGRGKLKVIAGHHRLHYAKRLQLPVYYVVDETSSDLWDREGASAQRWSPEDFAISRAKAGNQACIAMLEFRRKHNLTAGAAASLVGGDSAGSGNALKRIKRGTFVVGNMKHANAVVAITDLCRELGLTFATSSSFVKAVSMALRIPKLDVNILIHRLRLYSANMRKRSTTNEYLEEIEALYNFRARVATLPIKFQAIEIGRERKRTFGGKNK